MNEKRTEVDNREVTNQMTMLAVGASAICCCSMSSTTHVMFGLLGPNGIVKHRRCGPNTTTTKHMNEWEILSKFCSQAIWSQHIYVHRDSTTYGAQNEDLAKLI